MRSLAERISRYLSPPLFPVQLSDLDATIHFHDVPDGDWEIEGARISARHVIHLGPTVGYRVEHDGWSLAYLPDHEPALGVELAPGQADWISGYAVAHRADVLLHDAQYTEDEYAVRVGWGHSSIDSAVDYGAPRTRGGSCSSTTTPRTPTPTSSACSSKRGCSRTGTGPSSCSRPRAWRSNRPRSPQTFPRGTPEEPQGL